MKRYGACFTVMFVFGHSVVIAGSIDGVTKQLDGTFVPDVTIVVVDLDNGNVLTAAPSSGQGRFNVSLPAGEHVSVTFSEPDHKTAALVGISGDDVLTHFDIFLPASARAAPQNNCCCQRRGLFRRRH